MDKWIRLLFMILLIYNMLYDIILTLKQSGHSEFKDSKSRNSRTIADKAVMPLVLIMFIALTKTVGKRSCISLTGCICLRTLTFPRRMKKKRKKPGSGLKRCFVP